MTEQQALDVGTLAIKWVDTIYRKPNLRGKVKTTNTFQCDEIVWAIDGIFIDCTIGVLCAKDWDNGEEYTDEYGRTRYHIGLGDTLTYWKDSMPYSWTENMYNRMLCAIRIAVDLIIKPSGGVVGFTVGDLRKLYDGNIPEHIAATFECEDGTKLADAADGDSIWL